MELQKDSDRVHRFIEAFEKLYGRKPSQEDAEGNFAARVAQDMQMSVGGHATCGHRRQTRELSPELRLLMAALIGR